MRKKNIIILSILLTIILVFTGVIIINSTKTKHTEPNDNNYGYVSGEFNLNLIKTVNKTNNANYLISPYSIEIALNMLKNGAKDKTYDEILNVIGERNINDITIKDRISVANAAFIKSEYQKYIKESYYNTLKDRYQSEILYDEFKTPKIINNWVNTKTNGMIKEILNDVNENFVLGLANALAIDVEWDNPFECNQTSSAKFTKIDNKTMQVEMMHNTFKYSGAKYLKSATATGIIIPYKKYASNGKEDYDNGENIEFVAILPNDNVNDYIDSLNNKVLNELYRTAKEVNDEFERHLHIGGVERSEESFVKIIEDNFGLNKSEYERMLYLTLVKAKVEEKIDKKADEVALQVEKMLSANGGDYQAVAEALGEEVEYEETGGYVSSQNIDGGRASEEFSEHHARRSQRRTIKQKGPAATGLFSFR